MTLFPRQKVNGNREQSISRGFGSFLRPAIHMESVLDPRLVAKPRSIVLVLGWEPLQCQEESWGPGAEQLTPPREPDNSFQVTAGPGKKNKAIKSQLCLLVALLLWLAWMYHVHSPRSQSTSCPPHSFERLSRAFLFYFLLLGC